MIRRGSVCAKSGSKVDEIGSRRIRKRNRLRIELKKGTRKKEEVEGIKIKPVRKMERDKRARKHSKS